MTKQCTTCLLDKDTEHFNKHTQGKFGVRSTCKQCEKDNYQLFADKDKLRARNKVTRAKVLEANPDARRWESIKRKYNLTKDQWLALWDSQDHKCACCGRSPKEGEGVFDTDHCHATKIVRGICCTKCNNDLGRLGDTLEEAKARAHVLLSYLERTDA